MNDCLISIKRSHKALALSLAKHCHDKGMLRERGRDGEAERGMRTVKRSERELEKKEKRGSSLPLYLSLPELFLARNNLQVQTIARRRWR